MARPEDNHLIETIKAVMTPINREGYIFIAAFVAVTLLLALLSDFLGWIALFITLWCVYFFRDPERVVPTRPGVVVSPGDGVIQSILHITPPAELGLGDAPHIRISVFLNVFDVHVNRIPAAGHIEKLHYVPGLFVNASLDKASTDNERQLITIKTHDGPSIGLVQIAGLVARRIVCHLEHGQEVKRGERFGIIRFGSRVDVYLPETVEIMVEEGQRAVGGETVFAQFTIPAETV